MAANPEYAEAGEVIAQSERVLLAAYEELLRKVQLMGQTSFRDELKADAALWQRCEIEWTKGKGYRDRVAAHNAAWFSADRRKALEAELQSLIEREWKSALETLTSLFEPEV